MTGTAVARAQRCIRLIKTQNSRINALTAIANETDILKRARKADQDGKASEVLYLAVKDNFCTKELPTTCGSRVLEDFSAPYESTATKLMLEANAIVTGKANMDEFAMGSDSVTSAWGQVLNPSYETQEVSPGGSSGGSAAAVAAGFADVALGSDTGGSVRLPAAYCGVYGFKPSYGLLSRYGLISYAQSLDTVGILAKTLAQVERSFRIMCKHDENDPTSLSTSLRAKLDVRANTYREEKSKSMNIGVLEEAIIDLDEPVREAWTKALDSLESRGHKISLVSAPAVRHSLAAYYMIAPAEASSNLSRYDGIRYGSRAKYDKDGPDGTLYAPTRSEMFGAEVQRRLILGAFNLSAAEYEKHFKQAQRIRQMIVHQFGKIFKSSNLLSDQPGQSDQGKIDAIVLPTARSLPPSIAAIKQQDAVQHLVNDILTVPANLAGIPAISVPWSQGIGLQVWAQHGDDHITLALAKDISEIANDQA